MREPGGSVEAADGYRALFESLPVAAFLWDKERRRFAVVNSRFCELLGRTSGELLAGRGSWIRFAHPEDRKELIAASIRSARTGEPFRIEHRVLTREREQIWVRSEVVPVGGGEGRPAFWQGVVSDITDYREAGERLCASEAELRGIFAAMRDVIFVADSSGRYLKIAPTNPFLLYGPREELIGKKIH
ncbi:MAG: PAS domain S-box protein, partial [Actinomycetota bacterium]